MRRGEGKIELRFLGDGCNEGLDIDLRLLGPDQDPEAAELRLLTRLDALGYKVERLPPADEAA